MKNLILIFILVSSIVISQSDDENHRKYWFYRTRLVNDFTKVGTERGNSFIFEERGQNSCCGYDLSGSTDATSGCANSTMHSIEIFNPGISIQAINNPLCSGTTATLTASGASTYTWSTNAGSLTTNSVAVSPTANTTYTVTGTDAAHSCISST